MPGQPGRLAAGALLGRRYWRRGRGGGDRPRAWALLERFGLSAHADTYAGDLSGGQRRLVEIMRALMTEPTMLLLDEPMAGVHPSSPAGSATSCSALCAEGMTILMVEHELAIMDEFCDPVIVMAEGTVLAEGTMAALRDRSEVVEAYLAADARTRAAASPRISTPGTAPATSSTACPCAPSPARCHAIVGPNGSGKSTLLKAPDRRGPGVLGPGA